MGLRVWAGFLIVILSWTCLSAQNSRRLPGSRPLGSSILGRITDATDSAGETPVPGAKVSIECGGKRTSAISGGDGIFRQGDLTPGECSVSIQAEGYEPSSHELTLGASEVVALEIRLRKVAPVASPEMHEPEANASSGESTYREILRRPAEADVMEEQLPTEEQLRSSVPDRWDISMPQWKRNASPGDSPYVPGGHWYDPYNQNRLKADKPIIGQNIFLNFTGTSLTAFDARRLYIPSGVSAAKAGSFGFFGAGRQIFVSETARFSFDLFRGDTSFRPVTWRIRITPAVNINQIWTRERAIVDRDVRKGTDRTDAHVGLQEAFAEYKLHDLSPSFDFVSVRGGIQQFTSDFRGFVFSQEQPGLRVFGNLQSNRLQYNAAYFYFLEKDTNSGLNRFERRNQQVIVANAYRQDFFIKGYTAQASYHFNKDDATTHYDENGFLVRPAAIGLVRPHGIRSHYIGITGNGHIKRVNVSHAFYQVLGYDTLNPVAGRRTDINAQLGAAEVSYDRDWLRFRGSALFASGDKNPRDRTARGFDSIVEAQAFAGGQFSFFNREGIPLTGTSVPLTSPDSFLPNLRASREEGQANYVNPGIMLLNGGVDAEVTPDIRAFLNVNAMRFHHTEPLSLLLFQNKIASSLGTDYSLGASYRPKLSENVVLTGGASALVPGMGLRQIYTSKTLVSIFSTVRFQF